MSMSLNFLGGAPFQLLYDGVKLAIRSTNKFKSHLGSLEFTLKCLQPRIIEQIRLQNLQLNLPIQQIEDLQRKMNEGIVLVGQLKNLSMQDIRIWGNCCNCIKPDYAHQLDELNEALRRLLEILRLESLVQVNEVVILAKSTRDRQDELGRAQLQILKNQQYIIDALAKQQQVIERIERNGIAASDGGQGVAPIQAVHLQAIFQTLYDTVIQVKVKSVMFKRLLEDFKFTLDCLQPLIKEMVECRKVPLRLPKEEIESFIIVMEKGLKLIRKCPKHSQLVSYRKYEYINKLFALDETLQTLVNILRLQIEEDVREALVSVSNLEKEIKEIEGSGVLQHQYQIAVVEHESPKVGLEINDMPVRCEVDFGFGNEYKGGSEEESCLLQNQIEVVVAEPSSPTIAQDVLNMQQTLNSARYGGGNRIERKGEKETSDSARSTEVESHPIEGKEETTRSLPLQKDTKSLEEMSSIRKTRKCHRRHQKMSLVQKLYETSKVVFSSCSARIVPSSSDIQKLCSVLDAIRPVDVGLTPELPYFRIGTAGRTPPITYLHLFECDKFSMGIFCLPPSCVIPLHNHPGMTAFSKLLFGTMHMKSYDWVVDASEETSTTTNPNPLQVKAITPTAIRLAKVKVDADFTAPCNTSVLYPSDGGNMHCFTAVTSCAVLDVLSPPYSDPDGRHCQYYVDFPFSHFTVDGVSIPEEAREGYAWLQEIENPDDMAVVGALYRGPRIRERESSPT